MTDKDNECRDLIRRLTRKTVAGQPVFNTPIEQEAAYIIESQQAEIARLRDEVVELRKDAERYRWLRGDPWFPGAHRWSRWRIEHWSGQAWDPVPNQELDKLVDVYIAHERERAARAAKENP